MQENSHCVVQKKHGIAEIPAHWKMSNGNLYFICFFWFICIINKGLQIKQEVLAQIADA